MHSPRILRGILTGILTAALAASVLPDAEVELRDVIVRGTDLEHVVAAVTGHGGTVEHEIELIGAVSADVPAELLDELEADERTTAVTADAPLRLLGQDLHPHHRGLTPEEASHRLGGAALDHRHDGTGIDIAVIDSGIDAAAVPGLSVKPGINLALDDPGSGDPYGHGTAMAGIIGGESNRYRGTAVDADLIDVRVGDASGVVDVSQVLAAIDWVVTNRATDGRNVRVLSLSFGTDGVNPAATSPLAYAVEAAWRHGITVVAAAGNHGEELGRLASPAMDPWVIAVGAADVTEVDHRTSLDAVTVPAWSAFGDGTRNPDVLAPGRSILGGRSDDSAVARGFPEAHEGKYLLGSGTSQATAFTAGIVASMLEANPGLTPDQVKALLTSTAHPLGGDPRQVGAGVLDLGALFGDGRLVEPPADAAQGHDWSDGTGSLDGDRGRFVLQDADGNRLTGQHTVIGAFDAEAWRSSTWTGSSWEDTSWNSSTWTSSTWTSSTWTSSTWTSSTWTSSTWTGMHWGE